MLGTKYLPKKHMLNTRMSRSIPAVLAFKYICLFNPPNSPVR
jgi:hypothetical protein